MSDVISISEVVEKASQAAFGRPLITNVLRGHIVEAIVARALEPEWDWCAGDYSSWDFEREDGLRLQVKQSAAKQTWATTNAPSEAIFDIAARKGRWEGSEWVSEPGRAAHLYVFAHHDVMETTADHRDAEQWTFYVVQTSDLPETRRIGVGRVGQLSNPYRFGSLRRAVEACAERLQASRLQGGSTG